MYIIFQRDLLHCVTKLNFVNEIDMSIPSILVVEDDFEMQEMMLKFLRKNGFIVYAATNSDELQNQLRKHRIDLILLDVMLGDENGITICKEIRINQNIPIIIVSALATDQDRLSGYGVGADDYIVKPFNPDLLLARVKAVLKRGLKVPSLSYRRNTYSYSFDNWLYDGKKDTIVSPEGFHISLSYKETKMLKVFLANPNISLSREELANAIDDSRDLNNKLNVDESRAIDVLIGRLRSKIEKDTKLPTLIKTERGLGYIFTAEVKPKNV